MGHQGSVERKVQAIANMDQRILKPIREAMDASGEEYPCWCCRIIPRPSACGPMWRSRCPTCFMTAAKSRIIPGITMSGKQRRAATALTEAAT